MLKKRLLSFFIVLSIFVSVFSINMIFTSAEPQSEAPKMPTNNTNYLGTIKSFSTDLWGVDANKYVELNNENRKFSWTYFNGPFLVNGISLNRKHPTLLKTDISLNTSSGRVDLIFKAKGVNDYFAIYFLNNSVHLYRYSYSGGDEFIAGSKNTFSRKPNQKNTVAILTSNGKVSVWVDDVIMIEDEEIDDTDYAVTAGFSAAGLQMDTDVVTVSNWYLYYTEDENSFFPLPTQPEDNKNLIKNSNGIVFPYGNDGYFNSGENTIVLNAPSSGGAGLLQGVVFDPQRAYVLEGTLKVNEAGSLFRVLVGGNSSRDSIQIYFGDNSATIYALSGYVEVVVIATCSYPRNYSDDLNFAVLMSDNTITLWVNGKLVVEEAGCDNYYTASNIGACISGIKPSDTSPALLSNINLWYLLSDKDYIDNKLADLPELTLKNYRTMKEKLPAIRSEVNAFLSEFSDKYNESDLTNYPKLVAAEAKLNEFNNSWLVQDLMYIEDCITAIPKVTPDNCQELLTKDQEGTILYAEIQIGMLLEAYPELSIDDISNYSAFLKAKMIAENGGVSPNLFDNFNGASNIQGGSYSYDSGTNTFEVTSAGFMKFNSVKADPEQVYVFEFDLFCETQKDVNGWTRIGFKGSNQNDFVYVGFVGNSLYIYDPVNLVEQNLIGQGKYKREPGKSYHVEIITGPGFVSVVVDGECVISAATLDTRYTGEFFSCHTIGAKPVLANIKLSYYDGQPIKYTNAKDDNNLIYNATNLRGVDIGLGFYGTFDADNRTLTIQTNGMSGCFEGVKPDYEKPLIYRAKITAESDKGSVNLLLNGSNGLTGIFVGVSNDKVTLFEAESGLKTKMIQSVYFPREAGASYDVIALYENDKVSLFIDDECYYREESTTLMADGSVIGAYTEEIDGTAYLSEIDIHYASDDELVILQTLKDTMPEHKAPEIFDDEEEEEDEEYDYDYEYEYEDPYEEDEEYDEEIEEDEEYDEEEDEEENSDDEEDDDKENNESKPSDSKNDDVEKSFPWILILSIASGVIIVVAAFTMFVVIKKRKSKR